MFPAIRLHTSGRSIEFKAADSGGLEAVAEAIEAGKARLINPRPATTTSQQLTQEPLQALEKLTALRDAGYITSDEYEAKRQEILSRL